MDVVASRAKQKHTEQLDKLTDTLFTVSSLRELKQAFVAVLGMFEELVSGEADGTQKTNAYTTCSELLSRIDSIERERWKKIRLDYLADPYFADMDLNSKDDVNTDSPAVILLNLTKMFEEFTKTVRNQIEDSVVQSKKLNAVNTELSENVKIKNRELQEVRWQLDMSKEDAKTSRGELETLRAEMKTLRQTIGELKRDGTVQIWQREKEKLLAQSDKRIKELEEEVVAGTEERDKARSRYTTKITALDEECKMLKMKAQIKQTNHGNSVDTDTNKNTIYLLEKDILHLEKELKKQQVTYAGVLNGIRRDYKIVEERYMQVTQGDVLSMDISVLKDRCSLVTDATMDGKIGDVRDKLPDHYRNINNEQVKFNPAMKVSAYGKSLNKLETEKSDGLKPVNSTLHKSPATSRSTTPNIPPTPTDSTAFEETAPRLAFRRKSTKINNPILINPVSNRINTIVAIRSFPHISQKSLWDHWGHFCEFDTNLDGELDFTECPAREELNSLLSYYWLNVVQTPELLLAANLAHQLVVQALHTTVGFTYKPSDIEEAFNEIDVNDSKTLDFYEYVLLASRILDRDGNAEIFQSSIAKKSGHVISKTCVVQ